MSSDNNQFENRLPPTDGVEELFAEYVDRLNAGEILDHEGIRDRHPEIADALLESLEDFEGLFVTAQATAPLGTLGDYTLRRQIGRGGMGVVYEARENSLDRQVALKVLPPGIAADAKSSTRFLREAQIVAKLSHPQIVPVHATGIRDGTPWYAMEYVEGETLAQILAKTRDAEPEAETPFGKKDDIAYFGNLARAFADVADGLQHAHSKGVTHRDIKPSNLILDAEGRLRILDFGLARLEGQESLTLSGDFVGTPQYMSPEQARRKKISVDHRTDVYSLGATMYEAICARPAFRGKDHADTLSQIIERDPVEPRRMNPRVPKDLETIVLKCLRKDSSDRYGTAEALGQDLRRLVRGDPIEARPRSGWDRLSRRIARQKTRLAVSAVVVILVGVVVALFASSRAAQRSDRLARFDYEVLAALRAIHAGRFSLKVMPGDAKELWLFPYRKFRLPVVGSEEVTDPFAGWRSLEAAVKALEVLVGVFPERADARYHLAQAYAALGRPEDARAQLVHALEFNPDFVPALALRWKLSGSRLEDLEAILFDFEDADGWKRPWLEAYCSVERGAWSRVAEAYGELLALKDRVLRGDQKEPYVGCFTEAYLGRGVARLKRPHRRDWVEAQQDFLRAHERGAGIEALLLLAKAYYLNDQKAEAEAELAKLYARARPEDEDAIVLWIAAVYDSLSDYAKAREWGAKLREGSPLRERLESYFLYRFGEIRKAIEAGHRAIERNPRDATAHTVLGLALLSYLSAQESPESEAKLATLLDVSHKAVELDPHSFTARSILHTAQDMEKTREERVVAFRGLHALLSAPSLDRESGVVRWHKGYFADVKGIEGLNTHAWQQGPTVSRDGREIYFFSHRRGGPDLFAAVRSDAHEPFGPPQNLTNLNTRGADAAPSLSGDGQELYFKRGNPGDLFLAKRGAEDAGDPHAFEFERELEEINTDHMEEHPCISADGLELYFFSDREEFEAVYVAARAKGERFGEPTRVAVVPPDSDSVLPPGPSISGDGLTLFWRMQPEGQSNYDLWMASREAKTDAFGNRIPFGTPMNLGFPLNSAASELYPHVSSDWPAPGAKIYFQRLAPGSEGAGLYQATWHSEGKQNSEE